MTRIRVNTEDLKNKAKDFDSAAEAFTRAGDDILAAAMAMPSYDGQLSGPARKAGYEIQKQARELSTALAGDAESLRKSAQAFEEVDNEVIGLLEQNQSMLCSYFIDESPPIIESNNPIILDFISIPWSEAKKDTGSFWSNWGKGLEILGAIADLTEVLAAAFAPFIGPSDIIAFLDLLLAAAYSLMEGDTFFGKVSDDYPEMLVIGQDVWVTGGEFAIPLLAKLLGAAATGGSGQVPISYGDAATSAGSLIYDVGRLSELIPTIMTVGFFIQEGKLHIVFITNSEVEYPS